MKIRKGDNVMVLSGKDRGKTGIVVRAFPKAERVIVEGVNVVKRHRRATRRGSQGQIVDKTMPIHVSNVALIENKKPVRVGYTIEGEGEKAKKVRVSRKTGKTM